MPNIFWGWKIISISWKYFIINQISCKAPIESSFHIWECSKQRKRMRQKFEHSFLLSSSKVEYWYLVTLRMSDPPSLICLVNQVHLNQAWFPKHLQSESLTTWMHSLPSSYFFKDTEIFNAKLGTSSMTFRFRKYSHYIIDHGLNSIAIYKGNNQAQILGCAPN